MTDDHEPITVKGGAIRPFQRYCGVFADEYKLRFLDGEIACRVIDPANVAMADVRLSPDVTGEYPESAAEIETIGTNNTAFRSAVSMARKGRGNDHGDVVTLNADSQTRVLSFEVEREYDTHETVYETRHRWIDPDSMRQMPDIPSLDLPTTARIDREAFVDAARYINEESDHITFRDRGDGAFEMSGEGDTDDYSVTFEDRGDGNEVSSMVSGDYLKDIVTAVDDTKPDFVRIRLGDEFPVRFQTELPDAGVEAVFLISPRIQSE